MADGELPIITKSAMNQRGGAQPAGTTEGQDTRDAKAREGASAARASARLGTRKPANRSH